MKFICVCVKPRLQPALLFCTSNAKVLIVVDDFNPRVMQQEGAMIVRVSVVLNRTLVDSD